MSEIERTEFENVIRAMSEEEKKMALNYIETDMLWEELRKRELSERNTIKAMKDLLVIECN